MKKILFIATIILGFLPAILAQDGEVEAKREGGRVEALKIAYLTKKLNLSPEEAQKFWPIYNKYSDEIRKVRIESRQNKEAELPMEEKILNIRKRYNGEFNKALSTEKVNSFFRAEKEFGGYLQKEIQERRNQKMENRRRLKQ
jgi:hypothetical protein